MRKHIIRTDAAPAPIGPYSQATRLGDTVYFAGQGPVDPKAGRVVANDIQGQTRQTLENLKAIASAAGTSLDNAVKTTCFLKDMNDFRAFNEVYAQYFPVEPPARTTVQAARLPNDILVEIELIAGMP